MEPNEEKDNAPAGKRPLYSWIFVPPCILLGIALSWASGEWANIPLGLFFGAGMGFGIGCAIDACLKGHRDRKEAKAEKKKKQ